MTFKEKVYARYIELVNAEVEAYRQTLADLRESAANETKSTAGDKHETALAMLQIEQRNIKVRLYEAEQRKDVLELTGLRPKAVSIVKGSLVETDKGYFFLCVALGKINIEGNNVTAISPDSPLGNKLLGHKVNDSIHVNNTAFSIIDVQ